MSQTERTHRQDRQRSDSTWQGANHFTNGHPKKTKARFSHLLQHPDWRAYSGSGASKICDLLTLTLLLTALGLTRGFGIRKQPWAIVWRCLCDPTFS